MLPQMDERELRWQKSAELAEEILGESRLQLMLKFRFLDLALWRMSHEPLRAWVRYPLATDAKTIFYEPELVLQRFQDSFNEAVRDYLHMIMHCVMRHPFDKSHGNKQAWFLAADIIVETIALEMCGGRFESPQDERRRDVLSEYRLYEGEMTPYKLYLFIERAMKSPNASSIPGMPSGGITELQALFERDNHEAWPAYNKSKSTPQPGDIEDVAEDDEQSFMEDRSSDLHVEGDTQKVEETEQRQMQDSKDNTSDDGDKGDDSGDSDESDAQSNAPENALGDEQSNDDSSSSAEAERERIENDEQSEKDWEDIAKQIEMNLETFSKEWGEEAGSLMASLSIANRKKYDYTSFLQRFMTTSEDMKVNDDEFDLIFYTYGLKLYGNMPLIEPLEYKDTERIRDFVIAIDTSESVRGDLVRRFLEHTFSILKKSESFGNEVNIHVIQCDAKVQTDDKITDLRDVDALMEKFYIRGMGGTDFRPVFDYIERLRREEDLTNLKGMLYFTDGIGRFPEKTPDYDVAFVFMDNEEAFSPKVPPWAMKVVLDEQGINEFKSILNVEK